jgi:hypothetical protein
VISHEYGDISAGQVRIRTGKPTLWKHGCRSPTSPWVAGGHGRRSGFRFPAPSMVEHCPTFPPGHSFMPFMPAPLERHGMSVIYRWVGRALECERPDQGRLAQAGCTGVYPCRWSNSASEAGEGGVAASKYPPLSARDGGYSPWPGALDPLHLTVRRSLLHVAYPANDHADSLSRSRTGAALEARGRDRQGSVESIARIVGPADLAMSLGLPVASLTHQPPQGFVPRSASLLLETYIAAGHRCCIDPRIMFRSFASWATA